MYNKAIFFVISFLTTVTALSQVDSTYIRPYKHELSIWPLVYYKYTSLTREISDNNEITYIPNSPVRLGLGMTYKNYSIYAGYGFGFMRDSKRGNTKAIDLQYHYYGRKVIADIFFQHYKGFYTEEDENVFHLHPDIKIAQYGVLGQYVFNNKRFSYKAAFNNSEKQLKSAGSWQLGGGIYYNEIQSDSTLQLNGRNKLNSYQLNISGGYAYNWIINTNFYLAGGISLGVNIGAESLNGLKNIEVSPSVFPRTSLGYNAEDWSISITTIINSIYVTRSQLLKMRFDTGHMQLVYTKRFHVAPKFMKTMPLIWE